MKRWAGSVLLDSPKTDLNANLNPIQTQFFKTLTLSKLNFYTYFIVVALARDEQYRMMIGQSDV